jgi:hypothetical protein
VRRSGVGASGQVRHASCICDVRIEVILFTKVIPGIHRTTHNKRSAYALLGKPQPLHVLN